MTIFPNEYILDKHIKGYDFTFKERREFLGLQLVALQLNEIIVEALTEEHGPVRAVISTPEEAWLAIRALDTSSSATYVLGQCVNNHTVPKQWVKSFKHPLETAQVGDSISFFIDIDPFKSDSKRQSTLMESYDTAELARDVYRFITSHISYGIGILYSGNGFQFWIYHDPIAPQEAEDIRNKIVKSLAYEFPNVNIDQTSTNIRRIGALAGSIKRKGYCSTDERPDRVIGYWHDNPKKRLTVQQLKDFAFNLSVDVPSDVFAKKYTKNQSNVIIKWEELGLKESDYNIFELQHEASISRVATALNRGNGNPVCFHTPDHQAKWDPKHPNQWVCWGHRCAEVFPYRQDNPGAKPSYWTPISAVQHVTGMVQAGHAYDWLHQRGLVTTPRPPGINDVVAMRKYNRLYILCTPKQQQEIIKTIYVTSADVDKNNL